jgi:hypothetical protein
VWIWLGPGTESSDVAMDQLQHLHDRDSAEIGDAPAYHNWIQRKHHEIVSLLNRPYWKRIWIIQEVLLAQHIIIICGERSITWETLSWIKCVKDKAIKQPRGEWGLFRKLIIRTAGYRVVITREEQLYHITGRHTENKAKTLENLLWTFLDWKSSDQKDQIFAFLGILDSATGSQEQEIALQADYFKSEVEIFSDVMKFVLESRIFPKVRDKHKFMVLLQEILKLCTFDGYSTIDSTVLSLVGPIEYKEYQRNWDYNYLRLPSFNCYGYKRPKD